MTRIATFRCGLPLYVPTWLLEWVIRREDRRIEAVAVELWMETLKERAEYQEMVESMSAPQLIMLRHAFIGDRDNVESSAATKAFCIQRLIVIEAEIKKRDGGKMKPS